MAMANQKQTHKKISLPALIAKSLFGFALVSMLASLVSNQVEIAAKKQELAEIEAQVATQIQDNTELALLIQSGETEMVERVAREEYGYAAPNERVFVDMSGK